MSSASPEVPNDQSQVEPNTYRKLRANLDIVARKPPVGPFDELPEYWADGHKGLTIGQNIFSLVIPEGEMFFVRSVMRVKHKINDPQLLEDITNFAKQEAYHAKAHIQLNESLRKHGYDVDAYTKSTKFMFNFIEKFLPAKFGLGVTSFLEHITAMGAESAHRYPELQEDWPKEAREIWDWHAIEEMEHKSVAFDVLTEIGGGYFTRIFSAIGFIWIGMMMILCWDIPFYLYRKHIRKDSLPGSTPSSVTIKQLNKRHPGVMKRMNRFMAAYFWDYFKPGFHPWQKDHEGYIRAWREKNPEWSNS